MCAIFGFPRSYFDANHCQKLSTFSSQKPFQASNYPQFVAGSTGFGCMQEGSRCALGLACLQHRIQGCVSKHPKALLHPPPHACAHQPATLLGYWKGCLWHQEDEISRYPRRGGSCSHFRGNCRCWMCSPTQSKCLDLPQDISLILVERSPSYTVWWGLLRPGVSINFLLRGKHRSGSYDSGWWLHPKASHWHPLRFSRPWLGLGCCLYSRDRDVGWGGQDSWGWGSGIPDGGVSWTPESRVFSFSVAVAAGRGLCL